MIHSKFLVHWTGKDFWGAPDRCHQCYIERLKAILKDGFHMKIGSEQIFGSKDSKIAASVPRVCFTEIKLSQAHEHADRYGKLGIGVERDFVLKRHGNPVFYVQNGNDALIIENCAKLHKYLNPKSKSKAKRRAKHLKEYEIILSFLKNMSDSGSSELKYYNELEWRIIHYYRLVADGRIKEIDSSYYCPLGKEDIRIIVFPDQHVKSKALEDDELKPIISDKILVTLDDCSHF